MAYSFVNYTATGGQANWTFPFPYLDPTDVFATVDGELFFSQLVGPNTLQITPTPVAGQTIKIFRSTVHSVAPVDFTDGSVLEEKALDRLALFCLYAAQEAVDRGAGGGTVIGGGGLTMPEIIDGLTGQITLDQFAIDLANKIGLIDANATTTGSVAWRILQETLARQSAEDSFAHQVETLSTALGSVSSSLTDEIAARSSADTALVARVTTLEAHVDDGGSAAITAEAAARATADTALADQLNSVKATVDGHTGQILTEQQARATADTANAQAIQTVQSSLDTQGNRLATVEEQSSTSASALGIVNSNWTLKVQARSDNKWAVAGIGLNSTAASGYAQSEMIFLADKFQFISSINDTPQPLLQLGPVGGVNTLILAPTRYGDQTIAARMIIDGTITATKIDTRGLTIKDTAGNILFGAGNALPWSYVQGPLDGQNMVVTPSFENGQAGQWDGTVVAVSGVAYSKALMVRHRDNLESNLVPVGPGELIYMEADLASRSGYGMNFGVFCLDASHNVIGILYVKYGDNAVQPGGGWTHVSNSGVTPAGTVFIQPWIQVNGPFNTDLGSNYAGNLYVGRVQKGATYGASFGYNIFGQITASNISTYIASAAISWAYIGDLNIASNGAIHSGQTDFDTGTGFWMGWKSGVPKMSLGNSSSGFVWDGSTFTVRGNFVSTGNIASGANTQVVAGSFAGTGRSTVAGTTYRHSAITIGSITTSASGDGRVLLLLGASEWSTVSGWENLFYIAEASQSDVGGNITILFQVKRNGAPVYQQVLNAPTTGGGTITRMNHCQIVTDVPGPGVACTYTFEITTACDNPTNMAHQIMGGNYVLMEFKK